MKKITLLLVSLGLSIGSLFAQGKKVPFTEAQRYFVKNNYPDRNLHLLKITDQTQFENIFGMATVMGKNGQPTKIDFAKSFVITLIDQTSNRPQSHKIHSLTQDGNNLFLQYIINNASNEQGASYRQATILIVDKKYLGSVSANCYTADAPPMTGCDLDERGCKPSTGHSWSILENDCIQPWNTKYTLEVNSLNLGLLFNADQTEAEIMGLNNVNHTYSHNIILTKKDNNTWSNNDLSLTKTGDDAFILKTKGAELAKGKLRN